MACYRRLKNCTALSCFSAAARVLNVPRLRRFPVLGFFDREYNRCLPEGSLRIMGKLRLRRLALNAPAQFQR